MSTQEVAVAPSGPAQPPDVMAAPPRRTRNPRLQPEVQSSFQADGAAQPIPTPETEQRFASEAAWMPATETEPPPPQFPR